MAEMLIRPSARLIKPWYWLSLILILAIAGYTQFNAAARAKRSEWIWLLVVPVLMLLTALIRHAALRATRMTIVGDSLRFETGVFSKLTRNIALSKIQDVRVDQTLGQRILRLGNLSIETAGGASHITILNVERPQELAERILALSEPQRPDGDKSIA